MPDDQSTDILMKLVVAGQPVAAEAQTNVQQSMREGDMLMLGFKAGSFFEVEDVTLGFSATSTTTAAGAANKAIDAKEVSITRQIDAASPMLMQYCFTSTTLDSASIVKRRASGTSTSGMGYLRIDFTGVLLTGIDWSDAHAVKETITLIYREVAITYRPQLASGKLGAKVNASWAMFGATS
jgi:type VI secretion system secreted protein Hcp